MKHVKPLKSTVSFDFDGVLHSSVIGLHPINWDMPDDWKPRDDMFKVLKKEAESHRIIVVSARDEWMKSYLSYFIKKHKLPIEEIYCTNDKPKTEILRKTKSIRHYDDNPHTSVPENTQLIIVKPYEMDSI